jgi:hypothetical protein
MNTYQIVLKYNNDYVLAHIVTSSRDRAKYLFNIKYKYGFTDNHEIITLTENVTDKNGNSLKEKVTIFK